MGALSDERCSINGRDREKLLHMLKSMRSRRDPLRTTSLAQPAHSDPSSSDASRLHNLSLFEGRRRASMHEQHSIHLLSIPKAKGNMKAELDNSYSLDPELDVKVSRAVSFADKHAVATGSQIAESRAARLQAQLNGTTAGSRKRASERRMRAAFSLEQVH